MAISKGRIDESATSAKTTSSKDGDSKSIKKFPAGFVGEESTNVNVESDEDTGGGQAFNLTPVDRSRKKYFDEKAGLFRVLKWGIGTLLALFGVLATVLAIFYAYNISNIAEPIGGIKVEIDYLKNDVKDMKSKIEALDGRMNSLIDQKPIPSEIK